MQIPKPADCTTVFLCGPVSSGKSWLMKQLAQGMERSVTLDSTAECLGPEFEHIWYSPAQLAARLEQNPHYYRLAYHPKNVVVAFQWLFTSMWVLPHPRWILLDEIHEFCGLHTMNPAMNDLLRYSRKAELGIIGASHRVSDVSKLYTGNCRMVILFYTIEACDLEAIADRWGKEAAEQVSQLRPCIYDDASQEVEQHPQCWVWVRGVGSRIFSLGDKQKVVNPMQSEEEKWQKLSVEELKTPAQPYSELDSGTREPELPESTIEHGNLQ